MARKGATKDGWVGFRGDCAVGWGDGLGLSGECPDFLSTCPDGTEGDGKWILKGSQQPSIKSGARLFATATLSVVPSQSRLSDSALCARSSRGPQPAQLPLGGAGCWGQSITPTLSRTQGAAFVWRWQDLMSLQRIFKLVNRIAYLRLCLSLSICNKNQSDGIK